MTARYQPFFFEVVSVPESNRLEALLVANECPLGLVKTLTRLLPAGAVLDADLGREWGVLVFCTPEFARFHRARPAPARPGGAKLIFFRTHA